MSISEACRDAWEQHLAENPVPPGVDADLSRLLFAAGYCSGVEYGIGQYKQAVTTVCDSILDRE